MERVSIIVPIFNGARFLPDCLKSLLNQTFRDFRLYLIDDGSTDETPEICRRYSALDGRIQYIRQENRGVSTARNAGLRLAQGEFVTFCDSDDLWESTHLETLVRAAEETGADMVSCNYFRMDEEGNIRSRTAFPAARRALNSREETLNYIEDVLKWRTGWAVWARLFRREILKDLCFCEAVGFGEDLLFVLEAALRCRRAVSIVGGGCCYRSNPDSAMGKAGNKPMLEQRTAGAFWLWQRLRSLGPARHGIAWEILKPGLEGIPAKQLPASLEKLPQKNWLLEIARRVDSPLARFCLHGNVLRYRIDRIWNHRGGG